jgi:SnoaL-like domain
MNEANNEANSKAKTERKDDVNNDAGDDAKRSTWETYAAAWKHAAAADKTAALAASAAPTCVYRDPLTQTEGHQPLVAYMLGFHQQIPGGHFETTYFLSHHDRSIAKWNMRDGAGAIVGQGVSYGEYGGDGKLLAMTGFFDLPPQ